MPNGKKFQFSIQCRKMYIWDKIYFFSSSQQQKKKKRKKKEQVSQLCPRHFSQAIHSQTPHEITHSITPPFPKIHLLCQKCFLMAVSLLFSDRLTYGRVTTFIFSLGFLLNLSGYHITTLTTILPLPPCHTKKP